MFNQLTLLCCFSLIACIYSRQVNHFHDFKYLNASQRQVIIQKDGITSLHHKGKLGIVHGQEAEPGQFCYAVYLAFTDGENFWACTGSLVTPRSVLTAGHCVDGAKRGVAVVGATDLQQRNEPGRVIIRFNSEAIDLHKKYDSNAYNDISVITLANDVELNKYVCTVNLPQCSATKQPISTSKTYTACGYGKTSDSTYSTKLMYVNVPGELQSDCTNFYRRVARYNVIESQMCTNGAGGKGTCNGDSGGPLVSDNVQQGIVSLGLNTCEASAPSVYTDLNAFMPWLCEKTNKK